ncbi:MAG: hypothetical protein GPJ54_11280 [Candidatus Heimdallarchaeota archaeon]|nr:hypothetical protein [Candidatus Heimdallarchaeota archaeon]
MKSFFIRNLFCIFLIALFQTTGTSITENQVRNIIVPVDNNEIHYRVISGSGEIAGLGNMETNDTFVMIFGTKTELCYCKYRNHVG